MRLKFYINSQAPDQKSNPQAPDRTYTSILVKTPSQTFEIAINVFAGAENDKLPLKAEIYLRTSQKSLISIWIFSKKKYVYGDSETMSVRSAIPAWLIDDVGHHFNTISYK